MFSFDGLQPLGLLQLLNDVLAEIAQQPSAVLRDEAPEDTAARLLAQLRVLKYPAPAADARAFRTGLIAGERAVLHPILAWALPRVAELKKRAYLARFLVRLDVPPEMLQNEEVAAAHARYTAVLAEFTAAHKSLEALRAAGLSTADVKKDIVLMEQEREQLLRRIERVRKKSEALPQRDAMLGAARTLRLEQERDGALAAQRGAQEGSLQAAEQKLLRLQQQLADLQAARVAGGAAGLVARTEEELQTKRFLALEKLPRTLEQRMHTLRELQDA